MTGPFNALTIQSGVTTQIHAPNYLLVGAGIDTDAAGALTIGTALATSIVLGGTTTTAVSVSGTETFTVAGGLTTLGAGLTVTGTTTLSSLATAGVLHTDGSGVVSTSLIVDADVSASAAIAGTKISPNFGAQAVTTSGNISTTGSGTITSATTVTAGTGLTVTSGGASITGTTSVTGALTNTGNFHVTGTSALDGVITNVALGLGVVHSSSGGVFSSSTIVDADVSATANIAVSKLASGTAGQILLNNATPTPTWTTVTGDVSITSAGATKVTAIQNNPVNSTLLGATQDGYVLTWVNASTSWVAEPISSATAITLSGDVTGPSNSNTVVKINGTSVPATPTAAQVLIAQSGTAALWETFSQDATITTGGVVTVVSAHGAFTTGGALTVTTGGANITGTTAVTGNITATTSIAATTTLTAGTGLTVTSGGASITGGTVTDTLQSTGLATLNSASVTTTLGVTGVSTLTGGVLTDSVDTITATTLSLGSATATTVQLGKVGTLTEVLGNFKVDGTETIVGASTFQNPVTFDGNVTIPDGYTLSTDNITTVGAGGSGVMNINGAAGINLNVGGTPYFEVGTTGGIIYVPSGVTLEATGTGQIIATSSSGTTALTVPFTTTGLTLGYATYVSSNDTTSAADNTAITKSYCVGFVTVVGASGEVATDGLVTPVFNGSAPAVGQPAYLDGGANAGKLTATPPSASGSVVAPVGFMKNATQMIVRVLTPVVL